MKTYYVYILTNRSGTFYVGFTSDLAGRVYQHKNKVLPGFTARYHVDKLVFYEMFANPNDAIAREKQLKGWTRSKKITLIGAMNPRWEDLGVSLLEG